MNTGEREMYVSLILSQAQSLSELEHELSRLRAVEAPWVAPAGRGEQEATPEWLRAVEAPRVPKAGRGEQEDAVATECGPGSEPKSEPQEIDHSRVGMTLPNVDTNTASDKWYIHVRFNNSDA